MDIEALARPEILAMRPYASARSSMSAEGILLNANEAPDSLLEEPALAGQALNRYPAPQPAQLVERLASLYGVEAGQVLVTRGSDEGIDLLTRVFCRPGRDAILESTPCFGMYRIAATIQGAALVDVPREVGHDLRLDVPALCAAIRGDERIRLVFLTSPNNPTGDGLDLDDLQQLLAACEARALLVLDEAYIEFAARQSAAGWVAKYPQLVVLRTLSKAWAAAGLRCGTVIAQPVVIGLLRRVMAPYPLAGPAVDAALRVTAEVNRQRQLAMIGGILERKKVFVSRLTGRAWVHKLWPGEANFVLARVDDAAALTAWCEQADIRIRNFHGQPGLDQCVRFSIGNSREMIALAETLDRYGATA